MNSSQQQASGPEAAPVTGAPPPGFVGALRQGVASGVRIGLVIGLFDAVAASLRMHESIGWSGWLGCAAASVLVYSALFAAVLSVSALILNRFGSNRPRAAKPGPGTLTLLGLALGIFFELYWGTREYLFWGYSATSPERLGVAAALVLVAWVLALAIGRAMRPFLNTLSRLAPPLWALAALTGAVFLWQERALISSSPEGDLGAANRDLPNVLLVVVDALRADVIGAYGSQQVSTPVMDGLAEQGVLFENARVQAPFTWSSFGSFLTGKYPRRHGMLKLQAGLSLAVGINTTLPLHLKTGERIAGARLEQNDFVTAAFMTGAVTAGSGLLRGIDLYCEALKGHELVHRFSRWSLFSTDLVLFNIWNKLTQRIDYNKAGTTAEEWLAEYADEKRFFALLHLYSTHTPYDPAEEFRSRYVDASYDGPIEAFYAEHRYAIEAGDYVLTEADVQQIRALYYAGVSQADHAIGLVLERLERAGVLDQTIVIVTSDHGEELGDHGLWEHNWMYQTNLEIPLIMRWPAGLPENLRVDALVDSVDVLPTLCELMGLRLPEPPIAGRDVEYHRIDGRSLMPLVRAETDAVREFSFAESGPALAIQDLRWKLVVSRECLEYAPEDPGWDRATRAPQLFDLESDPDERTNLFETEHPQVLRLLIGLREWDASLPIPREAVATSHRDLEAEQLLDRLGYTGGIGGDEEADGRDE